MCIRDRYNVSYQPYALRPYKINPRHQIPSQRSAKYSIAQIVQQTLPGDATKQEISAVTNVLWRAKDKLAQVFTWRKGESPVQRIIDLVNDIIHGVIADPTPNAKAFSLPKAMPKKSSPRQPCPYRLNIQFTPPRPKGKRWESSCNKFGGLDHSFGEDPVYLPSWMIGMTEINSMEIRREFVTLFG
eukprot:TRINITY_DN8305_c0_g1_i3.p1 TRINITY_DN8305_c0_g1~~TRINITY_DN8305_c0_g1_i3.p1  ORF type:complete len:186 (+),score=20.37 TRINITY_DN8305_c0_g1_i3:109-666(+)